MYPNSTITPPQSSNPASPQPDDASKLRRRNLIIIACSIGAAIVLIVILLLIVWGDKIFSADGGANPYGNPTVLAKNPVAGEWACQKYSYTYNDVTDDEVTLELGVDGSYKYGTDAYGESYLAGHSYDFELEDKNTYGFDYYKLTFGPVTKYVSHGEQREVPETMTAPTAEIGIDTSTKPRQAMLIFTSSYNTYLCEERLW